MAASQRGLGGALYPGHGVERGRQRAAPVCHDGRPAPELGDRDRIPGPVRSPHRRQVGTRLAARRVADRSCLGAFEARSLSAGLAGHPGHVLGRAYFRGPRSGCSDVGRFVPAHHDRPAHGGPWRAVRFVGTVCSPQDLYLPFWLPRQRGTVPLAERRFGDPLGDLGGTDAERPGGVGSLSAGLKGERWQSMGRCRGHRCRCITSTGAAIPSWPGR